MPFSDLVHLEKTNLKQGILEYNRRKIGTSMCLDFFNTSIESITQLRNTHHTHNLDYPDYLLCLLSGSYKRNGVRGYIEYQSALRRFNNQLKRLANRLCIYSVCLFVYLLAFLGYYC